MALLIRKESEIYNQLMAVTANALGVSVDELGQQYHVENTVLANQLWIADLKASRVQENLYPDMCEESVLLRQGQFYLQRSPAKAVAGRYIVTVTSVNGAVIPKDTQFLSNTDSTSPSNIYVTDNAYSTNGDALNDIDPLPFPTGTIQIRALVAGIKSVLQVGDKLTSIQPLANATDEVVVSSIQTQPLDAESLESYRADIIQAMTVKNNIFSAALVRLWCSAIPELRTVYPYVMNRNPENVFIYAEATPENELPGSIPYQVAQDVLDRIYKWDGTAETGVMVFDEDREEARKVLGVINFIPLNAVPVAIDIEFGTFSDITKLELVKSTLETYVYDIRPYVGGAQSLSSQNDVLDFYQVLAVVGNALAGTGAVYTNMNMYVDGVLNNTNKIFVDGQYPYIRNVTKL